jgi:O-antigen biosynthesis protein
MKGLVDVVVPVYRDFAATRRCIEAVLCWPQATPFELVVIDDATPEPALRSYLDALQSSPDLTLIRNARNQGFARVANQGFGLHPDRDVVLLNSDTEVANDWLDRLRACAATDDVIATVTPFSNNATICSYPCIGADNPLPPGLSSAQLDCLFKRVNAGALLDLPTGVGFCMYVSRLAIDALGGFDALTFGKGYGEEVDFCLRGRIAGWRNVLCGDCFVYHQGGASFGAVGARRRAFAQEQIDRRFPDYPAVIAGFYDRDPPRPLRRAVDFERLMASGKPRILFISHAWGGGVQRHVSDLVLLLQDSAEVLLLQPQGTSAAVLRWLRSGEELALYLPLGPKPDDLIAALHRFAFSRVHYHHVQGFPEWILDLAGALALEYDVTLHDYFAVCPQLHFVGGDGGYCGEPDASNCERCVAERPGQWTYGIEAWRGRCLGWLRGATRVIAPAEDVARRMLRYDPVLSISVWPHPERWGLESDRLGARGTRRRKVVLLGMLSDAKGLGIVSEAAAYAAAQDLPVDFRVVGSLERPVRTWPEANLTASGEYAEDQLEVILEQERPDAFLFASVVPETYSYTLSVALSTGLPIIAIDIGAIGERLRGSPGALLLPADIRGAELAERAVALPPAYAVRADLPTAVPRVPSLQPDEYRERYLSLLVPVRSDRTIDLQPAAFYPPRVVAESPAIDKLYEQGVLCGKSEARAQLEREVHSVAARLDALERTLSIRERELIERSGALLVREEQIQAFQSEIRGLKDMLANFERGHRLHVEHLEVKTAGLQQRVAELEDSTFWKMTLPLRVAVDHTRRLLVAVRTMPTLAPRAWASAQRIQGEQGWKRLYAEAGARLRQRARPVQGESVRVDSFRPEVDIVPLTVPVSDQPLVTILIPTYGQHHLSYTCLKAVADHPPQCPIEIILVDDCAPEPAAQALGLVSGLEILRNHENLGFLRSCNLAAQAASGRYLLLLNNDTMLLPGCIDALARTFAEHGDVGAVGAKLLYPDGRLQEAGGIVWQDGSAWNWGRGKDPQAPEYNYVRAVDYCSAACLLLPSQLFADLGGFDERYVPAYYEDTDLCFALRERGLRVLYQPDAQVVHFEGASHGTDEASGLKAYQVRNRQRFQQKWAAQLSRHLPNGVCPERECDRIDGKRVLWVEACMLTPDQDSGSLRTWRLVALLQGLGCKVTFVAENMEACEPYTRRLQQQGIEVQHRPYCTSVAALLDARGSTYDVIVLCRHYVARNYVEQVRRVAPQALLVFDTIDLHYLRLRRQSALDGSVKTRRNAELAYREELAIAAQADVTLVVSEPEARHLRREVPAARVEVLSNVHDPLPAHAVPGPEGRSGILFVGGFQHPPNIDAVEYYAEKIWPRFRALHPDTQTFVIGSRMPAWLMQKGRELGLTMLGYVPDLEPYYRSCRLAVSPLRYGAGVKGKVNESLGHGLPVVATPTSVEGMVLRAGRDVLLADDPVDFAAAMSRLCADHALWATLSNAGLQRTNEQFSSQVATAALRQLLDSNHATSRVPAQAGIAAIIA